MDVFEAIGSRRSIGRVTGEEVSRENLAVILNSAVEAPNHRITEPWRFHVFTGRGRGELARVRAEIARSLAEEEGEEPELIRGRISRERKKAFRAPLVVGVVSKAGRDEVETAENYAACSAAVQNMQLAAHALGLGSIWRTGPTAYHELTRRFLGLENGDAVVAFLYVGRPDMPETRRRRRPVEDFIVRHEG
ncbi:nitroreductase family protein [Rubrobacter indicoceani]|uniref:nitroreductase family protein n=1 Tax=Rubrobacter indicoceani TaxID=2051957 RepID=UPI000E5B8C2C|nr:nitroreductase [Rubrobacter indicoceani]